MATLKDANERAKKLANKIDGPVYVVFDISYRDCPRDESYYIATNYEADTVFAGCEIVSAYWPEGDE
jgi:hypothetical protein